MNEILATLRFIQKELNEQKNTIKESAAKVTENINKIIDAKFHAWEEKYENLKQKVDKQEQRLDILEKQARKRNVVIFGIGEQEHLYSDLENIVIDFMTKHLSIQLKYNDIQELRRIGIKSDNPRPIVLTLTTLGKKIEIFKQKKLLIDTNYYIKEDYPQHVLEKRRELQEQLKSERAKGNRAVIKYDKLVILKKIEHFSTPENNKKMFLSDSPQEKQISQNCQPLGTQVKKKNKTTSLNTPPPPFSNSSERIVKPGLLNYFVNKTPSSNQTHKNKKETNY